eukprot:TRINITY_DN3878_c0_g1_i1.p2 TRINITY_DN3878_c0_g1~~TRINITY_DN3878_c0_g1_i1.p2  ORF type:complete len:155 (-),score=65.84 TRINITY_DN3878_c0_g1_i1:214-678(-)
MFMEAVVSTQSTGSNQIVGRMPSRMTQFLSLFTGFGTGKVFTYPPLRPETVLVSDLAAGNALLQSLGVGGTLIETPGHTDDSISVLMADGRCFCGDACMNIYNMLFNYLPFFIASDEKLHATWDTLRSRASVLLPGHGPAVPIAQLPPSTIISK